MLKLYKNEQFFNDTRVKVDGDVSNQELGNALITLEHFKRLDPSVLEAQPVGLWIEGDTPLQELPENITQAAIIAIHFPVFADGRGFSLGRQIREHLEFGNELRATGAFMQDQLFYLKRCGFNSFEVDEDKKLESLNNSFNDFSDAYQAAVDEPRPLFRRR